MDGVQAAYEFAGIVGIRPHKMTLAQLWRMASGRQKQQRWNAFHLVCMAFNDQLDTQRFLETGMMTESNVGKPIVLSPELEAEVQAEVERIRRENPDLPQIPVIG